MGDCDGRWDRAWTGFGIPDDHTCLDTVTKNDELLAAQAQTIDNLRQRVLELEGPAKEAGVARLCDPYFHLHSV